MPVALYVVYGSISAPIRNSPRSVCETYTWSCDETMITSRNGFTGSVTNAWRMCVVIGRRTSDEPGDERRPACGRAHDLAALDAAAVRLDGGDAVAVLRSNPVTSVYGWISTPRRSAARAKPHTTASWRMIPPGGW